VTSGTLDVDPKSLPVRSRNPLGFADGGKGAQNLGLSFQSMVALDYVVLFPGGSKRWNGLLFGLRAGYQIEPLVSGWSTVDPGSATSRPLNLPSVTSDGAFIHLVIGDVAQP